MCEQPTDKLSKARIMFSTALDLLHAAGMAADGMKDSEGEAIKALLDVIEIKVALGQNYYDELAKAAAA